MVDAIVIGLELIWFEEGKGITTFEAESHMEMAFNAFSGGLAACGNNLGSESLFASRFCVSVVTTDVSVV